MKAMVMAAGIGTRLRPLTYTSPKPMLPVVNKPVIEHTLGLLEKNNIQEIVINLHYRPEIITNYLKRSNKTQVKINYSYERKIMGTAGGVKKVEGHFKETFIILSGDGVTDIDLERAVAFHRRKKALATIVLSAVNAKFPYGVVVTKENGLVNRFLEKPQWKDVCTNWVNTGIYIMEPEIFQYIPESSEYDFGHQLFPKLVKMKKPIFGYKAPGYWCDIGDLQEYRRVHTDILDGKVGLEIPGKKIGKNIWVGKGTVIDKKAKLKGPLVIGANCCIEKNASLSEYTVLGNQSIVKKGARLCRCILWDKVFIARNVELSDCIIGLSANVQESISVFAGSIINISKRHSGFCA